MMNTMYAYARHLPYWLTYHAKRVIITFNYTSFKARAQANNSEISFVCHSHISREIPLLGWCYDTIHCGEVVVVHEYNIWGGEKSWVVEHKFVKKGQKKE